MLFVFAALLEYAAVNFISRQEKGLLELLQKKRLDHRKRNQSMGGFIYPNPGISRGIVKYKFFFVQIFLDTNIFGIQCTNQSRYIIFLRRLSTTSYDAISMEYFNSKVCESTRFPSGRYEPLRHDTFCGG